jgi:hypothetical protein
MVSTNQVILALVTCSLIGLSGRGCSSPAPQAPPIVPALQTTAASKFLAIESLDRLHLHRIDPKSAKVDFKPCAEIDLSDSKPNHDKAILSHPMLNVVYKLDTDPSGQHFKLDSYSLEPKTGQLSPLQSAELESSKRYSNATIDPTGSHLYLTYSCSGSYGQDQTIQYFPIDSAGRIDPSSAKSAELHLREFTSSKGFAVSLIPGPAGSTNLYAMITPNTGRSNSPTHLQHYRVRPSGQLELISTLSEPVGSQFTGFSADNRSLRFQKKLSGDCDFVSLDEQGHLGFAKTFPIHEFQDIAPGYGIGPKRVIVAKQGSLDLFALNEPKCLQTEQIPASTYWTADPTLHQAFFVTSNSVDGMRLTQFKLEDSGQLKRMADNERLSPTTKWINSVRVITTH